jgi:glyoxylase-like metal-dependent hydrolase (beta-lactamase superfamily II)
MKTPICLLIICLLLLPQRLPGQNVYSNEKVDVLELSDKAYLLQVKSDFTANCLLIEGKDGLLIVDTGFENTGEYFKDAINSFDKPVKAIVNSHAHHDHLGANQLFPKDVLIIGHKNCIDTYAQYGHTVQNIAKNPTYDFEGMLIFFLPYDGAHSSCDIMTLIPDLNMAFLGDLYLSESFPLIMIESGASAETLVLHLNEIFQSLPDNTLMIPGHGKTTNMEYFGGYIALVEETIEIVRKKMKSGWSLQKIQEEDVLKKYGRFGLYLPFITKESWIEQIYLSYSK